MKIITVKTVSDSAQELAVIKNDPFTIAVFDRTPTCSNNPTELVKNFAVSISDKLATAIAFTPRNWYLQFTICSNRYSVTCSLDELLQQLKQMFPGDEVQLA